MFNFNRRRPAPSHLPPFMEESSPLPPFMEEEPASQPVVIEIEEEKEELAPALSPAALSFSKLKAAQEAALIKKAELLEEQILQQQTKELLKEMGGAGLLPAQLQALQAEVSTEQEKIDSLLEQLGF